MKRLTRRFYIYAVAITLVSLAVLTVAARLLAGNPVLEIPPPNTVIVSKSGGGQFKKVSDAIASVKPYMTILVRPGVYRERITIDRPVEIIGDSQGANQETIIENTGEACIQVRSGKVAVRNLTLRSLPGLTGFISKFLRQRNLKGEPCVDVARGDLLIEDCDITSEAVAGIGVQGAGNKAVVRRCKIHSGNSNGIWFVDHAEGSVEDCEIFGTAWAGVRAEAGARPDIRRCKIHDVTSCGVVAADDARVTIDDTEIYGNSKSGVEIRDGSSAAIRNCKIHDQGEYAVWFHRYASGTVEDTEMFANHCVALQIMEDSNPVVSRCNIFRNFATDVEINKGADPIIKDCKIHDGPGSGIFIYDNGEGTIEDCEVFGHEKYQGVVIRGGSRPVLRRCRIHDELVGGVLALGDAEGTLDECSIYDNGFSGIWVKQSARPLIRKCKITGNSTYAVQVHESASPNVEDCDLTANRQGAWDVQTQCEVRKARNKE
ncbi:MAG TPA: right-handed parallel beta-helix repeat-containing protein [Blastocatellia bacterium]|nr:right-handed parallel beta-helix repeat-containing protein [Blastocatellia bacterium]